MVILGLCRASLALVSGFFGHGINSPLSLSAYTVPLIGVLVFAGWFWGGLVFIIRNCLNGQVLA